MSPTAIQKPWMKNLPPPVIKVAKAKAREATQAWNNSVTGILTAAKAINTVREKIGGKGKGSFSAWAKEELDWSRETAGQLATIGARHKAFGAMAPKLPPSGRTLYVLASEEDDKVFRAALRRVRPETTRAEVRQELYDAHAELYPTPLKKKANKKQATKKSSRTQSATSQPRPSGTVGPPPPAYTPANAAKRLIVEWRLLLQDMRALAKDTHEWNARLSPEGREFIQHQSLEPMIELLREVEAQDLTPTKGHQDES